MNKYNLFCWVLLLLSGPAAVLAQTNAPTNLAASALTSTSIRLTWTDNTGNETGFEVERSTDNRTFAKIADVTANVTSYTATGLTPVTQYYFRVRTKLATGATSTYSNVANATTFAVPPVVNNLTASAQSTTSIRLNWTDVGKEASYYVERRTGQNGTYFRIATTTVGYTDNNLSPGTEYCYRVQLADAVEVAGYSNIACATTQQAAPNAPARLTATAVSSSQINLQWADLSNNETGFQVERSTDGSNFSKIADVGANTTTFQNTGLNGNTRYWYRIRAVNGVGNSAYSNVADATTPAPPVTIPSAPTTLAAVAASATQINLSWTDNSNNETGFELERSTDGTNFTKIADAGQNATTFQNTGLNPRTRYWYRIRAVNSAGASAYSNVADATTPDVGPNAPARLTATAVSSSQINLQWADISDNETGFQVERSTDGTNFTKIADVGANTTTYQSTGLSPNTRYWYRVRAINAVGASGYSNTADATTPQVPPQAPSGLAASASAFNQINLSWTDNAANESGFELERSTDGTNFTKIADLPANTTTYQNTGLTATTRYWYRVRAVNSAGASAYSNVADATTPLAPPPVPQNLTAEINDYDRVKLSWGPLPATVTTVLIERSTSPDGGFTQIGQQNASQTVFVDAGLKELTTYYYRIRAVNPVDTSGYSNVASATTQEVIIGFEKVLPNNMALFVEDNALQLTMGKLPVADVQLSLHRITGQTVWTERFRAGGGVPWRRDVAGLQAGIYVVLMELSQPKTTVVRKILVP